MDAATANKVMDQVESGRIMEDEVTQKFEKLLEVLEDSPSLLAQLVVDDVKVDVQATPDDERLLTSVSRGDETTTAKLLAKGANPNYVHHKDDINKSNTPLIVAAIQGHAKVAAMLLDAGALVDVPSQTGCTPLIGAAQGGHIAVMRVLIQHGAHLEHVDVFGFTPVLMAGQLCHSAALRVLAEAGADLRVAWTPGLQFELDDASAGQKKQAEEFRGCNFLALGAGMHGIGGSLGKAKLCDLIETCLDLGMSGADLDGVAACRPLIQLIEPSVPMDARSEKLALALLDAGASPNACMDARAREYHQRAFIEPGFKSPATGGLRSQIWYHFATLHLELERVRTPISSTLTAAIASVAGPAAFAESLLVEEWEAARQAKERECRSLADSAICRKLLACGADPNLVTGSGLSPLLVALAIGDTRGFVMLLDHGADPDLLLPFASPVATANTAFICIGRPGSPAAYNLELSGDARCLSLLQGGLTVKQLIWLSPALHARFLAPRLGTTCPPYNRKTLLWLKGCALSKLRQVLHCRGVDLQSARTATHGSLQSLLIDSVTHKNPAEKLAFAIAHRNPAARDGQERVLAKLRKTRGVAPSLGGPIDLRELSLWNRSSFPPSRSMARTLFLAQTHLLNAMVRAERNYACKTYSIKNKADYKKVLQEDPTYPKWSTIQAQLDSARAALKNAEQRANVALEVKMCRLGDQFIEDLTNGLLEHRAAMLSSFRVGAEGVPLLDSLTSVEGDTTRLRLMLNSPRIDVGGMFSAVQTALNQHIGDLVSDLDGRVNITPQMRKDGISLPLEFVRGYGEGRHVEGLLAHERSMTDYPMLVLAARIKKTYLELGDGGKHALKVLRILVRYQIALAWKAALFTERHVLLCKLDDPEKMKDPKDAGLVFAPEDQYWRNAVQLATASRRSLPPKASVSVISETFIRGLRCRLIESLQAKEDCRASLPELVENAQAILASVERSPNGLKGEIILEVDTEDGDDQPFELRILILKSDHDDANQATTFTAVPMATAHLVLASQAPKASQERMRHLIQALLMWPSDVMQRPVTAWLLAQNQLKLGAPREVVQAFADIATGAEAAFLDGAFGEVFAEGDVPARDEVFAFLDGNDETGTGAEQPVLGAPPGTLTIKLIEIVKTYMSGAGY